MARGVERNETSAGVRRSRSDGRFTPKRWWPAADSSVTVNLGGQYTTLSVRDRRPQPNSSSSVIFEVYGDGKLLYQSPVMTSRIG